MKYLVATLLVIIVTVSLVPLLLKDPGHVLISVGDTQLETTLTFLLFVLVMTLVTIVISYRVIKLIFSFPDFMYVRGQQRNRKRKQENFYHGLNALAEGRWGPAEKLLISSSKNDKAYLLAYLGAARAAQHQGEHERRDQYLKLAHGVSSEAELATGITQVELQLLQGQYERALATANHIYPVDSKNNYLLELRLQLHLHLGDWDALKKSIPELRETGVIDQSKAAELELTASLEQLRLSARPGEIEILLTQWNKFPADIKHLDVMVAEFGKLLLLMDEHDAVEPLLRQMLTEGWNDEVCTIYAQLNVSSPQKQLDFSESWTSDHADNARVQLALSRIYAKNQMSDKAQRHLEASINLDANAESLFELGVLQEQQGDNTSALDSYRKGLEVAIIK